MTGIVLNSCRWLQGASMLDGKSKNAVTNLRWRTEVGLLPLAPAEGYLRADRANSNEEVAEMLLPIHDFLSS